MALKTFNPTTPGRRGMVNVDRSQLWKGDPEKDLTDGMRGTGGRNNHGHITARRRGGGTVFGPRVRSFAQGLPKKIRKLALKTALSAKQKEGRLVIIDEAKLAKAKTSEIAKQLAKLNWGRALIIDGAAVDVNFKRAAANARGIDVLPSVGANVYDILKRDTLVLTREGVEKLVERLK